MNLGNQTIGNRDVSNTENERSIHMSSDITMNQFRGYTDEAEESKFSDNLNRIEESREISEEDKSEIEEDKTGRRKTSKFHSFTTNAQEFNTNKYPIHNFKYMKKTTSNYFNSAKKMKEISGSVDINDKQNTFEVQNDSIENKINNDNEIQHFQPTLVINSIEEKPELTNNEDFESSYL